jgi:ketosteroid isomerase-like protein
MTSTELIQEPITGREALIDLSEPAQALAQFYRAFNNRDLDLMAQNWDDAGESEMTNPLGGIKRGWPAIRTVYERIFNGGAQVSIEFHDYTLHRFGDIFYVVGQEQGVAETDGRRLHLTIRTSRVFRRIGKRWRQIHHHGSFDDPTLLEAYQSAVG